MWSLTYQYHSVSPSYIQLFPVGKNHRVKTTILYISPNNIVGYEKNSIVDFIYIDDGKDHDELARQCLTLHTSDRQP